MSGINIDIGGFEILVVAIAVAMIFHGAFLFFADNTDYHICNEECSVGSGFISQESYDREERCLETCAKYFSCKQEQDAA